MNDQVVAVEDNRRVVTEAVAAAEGSPGSAVVPVRRGALCPAFLRYRRRVEYEAGADPRSGREVILDAAENLMAERGYARTSIAAIREASGLTTGSIYWHFGNKAGIAAAVMRRGADSFFAQLPRAEDLVGEPVERLRTFFDAAAVAIAAHPAYFRLEVVLNLETQDDDEMSAALDQIRGYVIEEVASVVEPAARDAGVLESRALAVEMAELTIDLTRGSLLSFGDDRTKVPTAMRRLHQLIVLSIEDAARRGAGVVAGLRDAVGVSRPGALAGNGSARRSPGSGRSTRDTEA